MENLFGVCFEFDIMKERRPYWKLKCTRSSSWYWRCGPYDQLKVWKTGSSVFCVGTCFNKVPKSGEVWCEAARLALNPTMPFFTLAKAQLFLKYAIQFTPQYGDSFLEFIRYLMVIYAHDMFLKYLLTQVSSNDKKLENYELSEESMLEFIGTVDFKDVVLSSLNQQCLNPIQIMAFCGFTVRITHSILRKMYSSVLSLICATN